MRLKRFQISGPLLVEMFTQDNHINSVVIKGLPPNAKFEYGLPTTLFGGVFEIVVSHESYDDLKEGDLIPLFNDIKINRI